MGKERSVRYVGREWVAGKGEGRPWIWVNRGGKILGMGKEENGEYLEME